MCVCVCVCVLRDRVSKKDQWRRERGWGGGWSHGVRGGGMVILVGPNARG